MDPKLEALVEATTSALKSSPPKRHRLWEFLNSSFVLTVIGGLVISLVGIRLQQSFSKATAESQRLQAEIEVKRKCLMEFAEAMSYGLDYEDSMKKREIWLAAHQRDSDADKAKLLYPDGRTFKETRDQWEALRKESFTKPQPLVVSHYALAVFRNADTRAQVRTMITHWNEFRGAKDMAGINRSYENVMKHIQTVLDAMGKELAGENTT